jgi:hypothetical protein
MVSASKGGTALEFWTLSIACILFSYYFGPYSILFLKILSVKQYTYIELYQVIEVPLHFVSDLVYWLVCHSVCKRKLKNGVFWDVTPCGSCKNRRFGGT